MPRKTRRVQRIRKPSRYRKNLRNSYRRCQKGGLIESYAALFNSYFGNDWILTGSEAVRLLAKQYGIHNIDNIISPNDVDILVVSKDMIYRDTFGTFVRTSETPTRSMTFREEEGERRSFDVMTVPKESYVVVEYQGIPVRVKNPQGLLRDYKSELATRGNKQNADWMKIFVLEQILLNPQSLKSTVLDSRIRPVAIQMNDTEYVPSTRGSLSFETPPRTPPRHYGGLGRISPMATVDIQADPYSARMLVNAETAENILSRRE